MSTLRNCPEITSTFPIIQKRKPLQRRLRDTEKSFTFVSLWQKMEVIPGQLLSIATNLNRVEFTLSEVLQAYRLRWQIELIFKEIKSYSGWHRFNTKSATLVFSLILMPFVVVTLKRYLAHAAQANLHDSIDYGFYNLGFLKFNGKSIRKRLEKIETN